MITISKNNKEQLKSLESSLQELSKEAQILKLKVDELNARKQLLLITLVNQYVDDSNTKYTLNKDYNLEEVKEEPTLEVVEE